MTKRKSIIVATICLLAIAMLWFFIPAGAPKTDPARYERWKDTGNEPGTFGKNLCPLAGTSIEESADGLERTLKIERDWLGEKYGPIQFTCEASSIERLLEFVACGPGKHFDDIVGTDCLPIGTYRYSFNGKTWDDHAALLKDVMSATSETFGLTLKISSSQGKTTLVIKSKKNAMINHAPEPTLLAIM
ncbi:MAG TPA: hypothetical protein VGJ73_16430 [Verrucomicrobiae bacterium]|jgi:hypothetical protein